MAARDILLPQGGEGQGCRAPRKGQDPAVPPAREQVGSTGQTDPRKGLALLLFSPHNPVAAWGLLSR